MQLAISLLFCFTTLCCCKHVQVNTNDGTTAGSACNGKTLGRSRQSEFWINKVQHGISAFNYDPKSYKIFRNVKDYGAKGDGVADDTIAINTAITEGHRCGLGCGSSTVTPAIVYFPPGKYVISAPLIQYYYTQFIGDAISYPTLVMAPNFKGIGLIDSDPYANTGNSWWTNQNNFYRQVRNFIIDTTRAPPNQAATAIHWQVAQATTITNVHFKMSKQAGNAHQGIWMENGSGGFMSDLTFEGGKFAMWVGNQQFTSRNLTIRNADTAIYMNWNWGWTFKGVTIENCKTGIDMTAGGQQKQGVGTLLFMDSHIINTEIGVKTEKSANSLPHTAGTLLLDNVQLTNVRTAVTSSSGHKILDGGSKTISLWGQGQVYTGQATKGTFNQGQLKQLQKPSVLLDGQKYFERAKPEYIDVAIGDFVSVKSNGAKGDGKTDDTKAIADTISKYAGCKVIYFPSGTYLVSDTIHIPVGTRIVGEIWPTISATGSAFSDAKKPRAMFEIGKPGDVGVAEISDVIFSTVGPVPGAILVQINAHDPSGQKGAVGLWDVHFRVGGATGTRLTDSQCRKESAISRPECFGAFLMLHITSTASAYLENVWAWVSDHDLDGKDQISIYNGRGVLIESKDGPVWMYGTASEHSVLYQYSVVNAKNVLMAMIQTETPYFQSRPPAPSPITLSTQFHDPDFKSCGANSKTCPMAWGLMIKNSQDVFIYGAGLYNFFQAYGQECLQGENCQDDMVSIEQSHNGIHIFNLNTKASTNMIRVDGKPAALQSENRNTFCSSINAYNSN